LFQSSARLIGHPLALRLDRGDLQLIVEAMRIQESLPKNPA
ncbi:MAG: ATP phosphoribosyltransferase, partial [Cyanobacteriota bacterium]|nr:ATP phosphoribosyltransferase [Cyanobacteriota bacterium]